MKITMHREQTWKYRESKLYKLTDTMRQIYVELENSNVIPQNRNTRQNHNNNNQRFEEIQLGKFVLFVFSIFPRFSRCKAIFITDPSVLFFAVSVVYFIVPPH